MCGALMTQLLSIGSIWGSPWHNFVLFDAHIKMRNFIVEAFNAWQPSKIWEHTECLKEFHLFPIFFIYHLQSFC